MSRIVELFLGFTIIVGISGCASSFHQTPYIAYPDSNRPLSETAVFTALDKSGSSESRITQVNGVPTSCWEVGCPYWVRLSPGKNIVAIHYLIPGLGVIKYADVNLTVQDMKPRHIYRALYTSDEKTVTVRYEDLGENPDYYIPLYLDGKKYRAKF